MVAKTVAATAAATPHPDPNHLPKVKPSTLTETGPEIIPHCSDVETKTEKLSKLRTSHTKEMVDSGSKLGSLAPESKGHTWLLTKGLESLGQGQELATGGCY